MSKFSRILVSLAALSGLTRAAFACEACALYIAEGADRAGYSLSVTEQFTRLGTVWSGSSQLGNPVDQYLESSITQFTLGYSRGGPWHVQLTLPWIRRWWLRPEHALIETGRESGWGDATLAANYRLWQREVGVDKLEFSVLSGVKLPTGNADHLGDEIGHHFHHHAGFPDSGVHGHDLALGSGSTDFLLGADAEWRHDRWFVRGHLQYRLRQTGKFDYRLADETAWEIAPGAYVLLEDTRTLALEAIFSADHKGLDTLAGEAQVDTGFSGRYVGGRVRGTLGERWSGEASLELPVRIRTTETMVVPDYRARASVSWRF